MRSDNSGRRERTRPGFYFMFCVWQSSVRGCRFSVMFVYFVIKMCLNVRRFPPPSSRTYLLRYRKFLRKNIPGFFSIKWTSMEINRLKVQIVVSIQLQMTLHDPSQGINVVSSELISNFLIYMYIYIHTHTHRCISIN